MNKLVLFLLLMLCSCSDLFDDFGGVNVPVINDVSSDNVQTTDPNPGSEYSDVTIVFKANDGIGIMEKQIIKYGKSGNLQANTFTYDGYTFTGWNTKSDGSGTHYQDKQNINVTSEFLESLGAGATLTLYAQWEKTPDPNPGSEYSDVTIVFKANGGAGTMEN
ncbi:MAG: InlB B-repeat-containing protein, partial [Spirochaetota bacterium]|nr:InlB B-repeat-containing protein [Spirochaetota bacterium]